MQQSADYFDEVQEAGEQWLPASFFDLPSVRVAVQHGAVRDPVLSTEEQVRLESFRSAKRRAEFARGRTLLRRVLAEETGTSPLDVPLISMPGGGLHLDGSSLHFSLTHTGALAAVALSPAGVGIDAERVRPVGPGLLERICGAQELPPSTQLAPLVVWCAKEAVLKSTGHGVQAGLQQVVLEWEAPSDTSAPFMRAAASFRQLTFCVRVRVANGTVWALAVQET